VTWEDFVWEFRLCFIEENKQDHALHRLKTRAYYMGSQDSFMYTDDLEDLVELAGFKDPLMKVTKYRTGLDPAINHVITSLSDPLDLHNYPAWCQHAYRQYESQLCARTAVNVSCVPPLQWNVPSRFR
jgi:hypothetical protein